MDIPKTLGELKASGYRVKSVKEEMRDNLIQMMKEGVPFLEGIVGYDDTVIPELQNAILSKHDILLLGLRGQAKTKILRQLVRLLDEQIPIVQGSEVNDNPYQPISKYGRDLLAKHGDRMPIEWIGRDRRYQEKLATPDVTIADLIGDVDIVKHAEGRYLSDELTIHYGLVPRTNRGIFCINELPDLAPRVQVGLFNVLEERDIQIRGYAVRLPLDMCLVFSANPEDYTSRGRIVTPLKDRIGSVIRTHYPRTRQQGIEIMVQQAWLRRDSHGLYVPRYIYEIVEETVRLARAHPAVNQHSGVSVRFSISGSENVVSNAERRAILLAEYPAVPRISDLDAMLASGRGKIELALVEELEQEDAVLVKLIAAAVKSVFEHYAEPKELREVVEWFEAGNSFRTGDRLPAKVYVEQYQQCAPVQSATAIIGERMGLKIGELQPPALASLIEFLLEGLHVNNRLSKQRKENQTTYRR
ncbi:MAG: magnesium chelatase [Gemmataceae bacterium]